MARKKRDRVSKKISKLRHESPPVPQRQAVAMSLEMQRHGRLTKSGGYRRVKKSRSRRRGRVYNRSRTGRL